MEWALNMVGVEQGREFRFRGDLYSQESTFPLVYSMWTGPNWNELAQLSWTRVFRWACSRDACFMYRFRYVT